MSDSINNPPSPDVIPVRDGEQLDFETLTKYLDGKLPGAKGVPELWQFGGGHANLTYLLYYPAADLHFTLRRPPLGPVAASSHDMSREYRALSVLYKAFPLAPRAHLFCDDTKIIGAPFFVMERRHGIVVRASIPPEFGGGKDPVANRKLSEVLIDTLAELHCVDTVPIGLDRLGKPEGFMQRQVTGWTQRWERAKTTENATAQQLARWLADNLPESPSPVLLHNDWKLDNMMIAPDDPGRAVAVFDWDMCTIGDPLADLGTLLTSWFEASEPGGGWSPMPTAVPGFITRREAVDRYAKRTGIPVDNIGYYRVFGIFKMAVVIQQIYHRFHGGQTSDDRFRDFGAMVDLMLTLATKVADHPTV